jgi:murein L,D-transpeptidase YafK
MPGRQIRLLVLVLPSFVLAPPGSVSVRDQQWKFPRVRRAAKDKDEVLRQTFASKKLSYPPKAILLRAFKKEGDLELWVENSSGTYMLAKNWFRSGKILRKASTSSKSITVRQSFA